MFLNKHSLKIEIFKYLIIFSSIILIMLWFLQVFFLNTYYETYKIKELEYATRKITKNYKTTNFYKIIDNISYDKGVCIEIINNNNNIIYTSDAMNRGCITSNQYNLEIESYKKSIIENNIKKVSFKITNPRYDNETLVYGISLDNNIYAFINTSLVPIESTIIILKNQLITVTIVVLILSILIAYFISKKISTPLSNLNKSAKQLASKDYKVKFDCENGCSEITDLATTLNYASSELSKSDELRRELMANVSHDLKTPLTMIKAYAEMIKDLKQSKKKKDENLNIIIDETDRLTLLVNDILTLSKLESNIEELKLEKVSYLDMINNILNHYQIYSINDNYTFQTNFPKENIILNIDKKKIEQVLYNLINNAINYTGNDKLIKINVIELSKSIRTEIIDTGNGIDKKDLNKIWDKYYRTDKQHQRSAIGNGIGLSIVKNIFILHKITYGVISNKEQGTIFYFEIKKSE